MSVRAGGMETDEPNYSNQRPCWNYIIFVMLVLQWNIKSIDAAVTFALDAKKVLLFSCDLHAKLRKTLAYFYTSIDSSARGEWFLLFNHSPNNAIHLQLNGFLSLNVVLIFKCECVLCVRVMYRQSHHHIQRSHSFLQSSRGIVHTHLKLVFVKKIRRWTVT